MSGPRPIWARPGRNDRHRPAGPISAPGGGGGRVMVQVGCRGPGAVVRRPMLTTNGSPTALGKRPFDRAAKNPCGPSHASGERDLGRETRSLFPACADGFGMSTYRSWLDCHGSMTPFPTSCRRASSALRATSGSVSRSRGVLARRVLSLRTEEHERPGQPTVGKLVIGRPIQVDTRVDARVGEHG